METGDWILEMEDQSRNVVHKPRIHHRVFYRVPYDVRKGHDPLLFSPLKTSIGPYHHSSPNCLPGEGHKEQCLHHFLQRSNRSLEQYIEAVAPMADELRDVYAQFDPIWNNTDAFLRMMVVDGCFLLEILMAAKEARIYGRTLSRNSVFDLNEMDTYRRDMLLVDNQIPIKLLLRLASFQKPTLQWPEIYEFVIDRILNFFSLPQYIKAGYGSFHILDVYRNAVLKRSKAYHNGEPHNFNIPPATNLHEARIGMTTSRIPGLMYISFSRKTLWLPQVVLRDSTKSIFHNLVLFEQIHPHTSKYFSSYIYFMGCLLKDAADSNLLRERGIIYTMWRDEEVVELFDELCKDIEFNYDQPMDYEVLKVGKRLRERYNKNSEEWRRHLFQTYLRSPWAIISVFAAFCIFSLSAVQTAYTVLGYYNR